MAGIGGAAEAGANSSHIPKENVKPKAESEKAPDPASIESNDKISRVAELQAEHEALITKMHNSTWGFRWRFVDNIKELGDQLQNAVVEAHPELLKKSERLEKSLVEANSHIGTLEKAKTELETSNAELDKSHTDLDKSHTDLKNEAVGLRTAKTNAESALATEQTAHNTLKAKNLNFNKWHMLAAGTATGTIIALAIYLTMAHRQNATLHAVGKLKQQNSELKQALQSASSDPSAGYGGDQSGQGLSLAA